MSYFRAPGGGRNGEDRADCRLRYNAAAGQWQLTVWSGLQRGYTTASWLAQELGKGGGGMGPAARARHGTAVVGMPWALRGAYSCLRYQHPARVACGSQALKSLWFSGALSTTCLAARMAFIHMDGAWR